MGGVFGYSQYAVVLNENLNLANIISMLFCGFLIDLLRIVLDEWILIH